MKNKCTKLVLLALLTFYFTNFQTVFGQVPQAINFQAIARDGNGSPMVNTSIQIRLSVIDSAQSGTFVYQELRALQTNAYGSFSFLIGVNPAFTTIGTFSEINWETGNKFLKIDYDPTNTFTFNLSLGTIRFVSVPYAFSAETVEFIDATGAHDGDALVYNSTTGKFEPEQVGSPTVIWDDVQNKPSFATVSVTGSYADLLNKPTLFSGIYSDLTNKPLLWDSTWATIKNKPTTLSGYGITNAITTSHVANSITATNIANWNTAFGWGNHDGLYRPISYVPSWTEITGKPSFAAVAISGSYSDLLNKPSISDSIISKSVLLTGNQTIAGNKTFTGTVTSASIVKTGGTSSQFLKADGSVDNTAYSIVREVNDEFTATSSQTSFSLTQTPNSNSKIKMYVNGIRISKNAYSIAGNTLTYTSLNNGSYNLTAGDRIQIEYYY